MLTVSTFCQSVALLIFVGMVILALYLSMVRVVKNIIKERVRSGALIWDYDEDGDSLETPFVTAGEVRRMIKAIKKDEPDASM